MSNQSEEIDELSLTGLRNDARKGINLSVGIAKAKKPLESALICGNCNHWQRDLVGDGTGLGVCLLDMNPFQLKWPGIPGCTKHEFKKMVNEK